MYLYNFSKFKYLIESVQAGNLRYQKCEGGDGIIDPTSFERVDLAGKAAIKFINDNAKMYTDQDQAFGSSDSINNCLGGDPNAPLTGRFFEVKTYDIGGGVKAEYASFELKETGEELF
jgi:hypothetical protein